VPEEATINHQKANEKAREKANEKASLVVANTFCISDKYAQKAGLRVCLCFLSRYADVRGSFFVMKNSGEAFRRACANSGVWSYLRFHFRWNA
jgi:hypothetical protein